MLLTFMDLGPNSITSISCELYNKSTTFTNPQQIKVMDFGFYGAPVSEQFLNGTSALIGL